jgi:hypothetical protein
VRPPVALAAAALCSALAPPVANAADAVAPADAPALARVQERLALAAEPWCDRAAEPGPDGLRRCTLRVTVLDAQRADAAPPADSVLLLRPLVEALDEATLAVVVGRKLARLVLGHVRPAGPEGLPAQVLDADALGLVLAMRAGYPASAGARLFESVHGLPGWEAGSGSTHPAPAERAAALREVARQACARLGAGRPLLPAQERLLPLDQHRRDEAGAAPGAWPPASVCDGPAPPMPRGAGASATPFATPFTLGRHGPGGACPHCDPR